MPNDATSILITGANGFVGARLCHRFVQEGFRTIAAVRETSDLSQLEGVNVELRFGDVTRAETLPALVTDVDYIVHNAGLVKARDSQTLFDVNETGTRQLMETVARHDLDVRKVVHISSLAAAGPSAGGQPVTEEDEPRPITAYARSKLAGERAALSFADRFPVIALRPSGVYGPGDREIFSFFQAVYRGLKPIVGDPERKIQLVHVDDLARAVFLAISSDTASSGAYFIAEDRAYAMRELVDLLQQACGKKALALKLPAGIFRGLAAVSETALKAFGGTPMLTREKAEELLAGWEVSTAKASGAFGFSSRVPFPEGARETYAWYLRNGWL